MGLVGSAFLTSSQVVSMLLVVGPHQVVRTLVFIDPLLIDLITSHLPFPCLQRPFMHDRRGGEGSVIKLCLGVSPS